MKTKSLKKEIEDIRRWKDVPYLWISKINIIKGRTTKSNPYVQCNPGLKSHSIKWGWAKTPGVWCFSSNSLKSSSMMFPFFSESLRRELYRDPLFNFIRILRVVFCMWYCKLYKIRYIHDKNNIPGNSQVSW
jgi:hypothetical protein